MEERLALRQGERDRLVVLRAVISGDLGVGKAAQRLGLSSRQVRRLVKSVRAKGDKAVIHGLRGRNSNRKIDESTRQQAMKFLAQPVYRDFGPTLAAEHLALKRDIHVSRETLRKWMSGEGLWRPRRQKIERVHTWRERRAAFGELVLMDSSDHDWLEGRGPRLSLIAMIDDATDRLVARFVEHDTSLENIRTVECWLRRYGRPLALYTDRHSIFTKTRPKTTEEVHGPAPFTSFRQCLEELKVEWIAAYSPQAKGRVERLFETLQDRLVKELRVAGICSAAEANRFFDEVFLPQYTDRFTHTPRDPKDAHRAIKGIELPSILSVRDTRTITADYTLTLDGQRWAVTKKDVVPGLRRSRVIVETRLDGTMWARFKSHRIRLVAVGALAASPSGLRPPEPAANNNRQKRLPGNTWKPPKDHPWRKQIHADVAEQLARRTLLPGGQADISTLR
jgi:transposase